ncbi:hypothetical protein NKH37_11300 [Mesorhizobium sp. M1217]|uniref:DUF7380 domain-containing protein n=1 Tax=Mesorhizobium sp. M1217 TaxID=2957070 RepID=UPI00333AF879
MSTDESSEAEDQEPTKSAPAPGVAFVVPIETFRLKSVTASIDNLNEVDIQGTHTRLAAAATAAREVGDPAADALQVLSGIASYHFVPENRVEPFQPMATFSGRRTLIPGDLLAEQIEVLAAFSPDIPSPALRARVSDVCRLRVPKNANAGMRAVGAYVDCVAMVLRGEAEFAFEKKSAACVTGCELLRRATIIARRMGWDRAEFDPLRNVISDVSQMAAGSNDSWGFVHIAPVNLDNGIWEPKAVADAAEQLATHDKIAGDHFCQRELWQLAARAYHRAKDNENESRCLVAAGETYVGNADARPESAMVQVSFLDSAIEALRPIPGTAQRRRELQDRLNAIQPNIRDEMSSFSHEQDITELVGAIETAVSGKPLPDVLKALFTCERSPEPDALRKQVLENGYGSISAMMPMTLSDHQGRTRFKAPGLSFAGPPDEDQVRFLINQQEQFRRQMAVAGKINTIRRVIMNEHYVSLAMFMPVMQASAFVPPDHELIFAKGAFRFLAGDDIEAAHLVLPQLENSLRHMLALNGIETNRINPDGTQEEAMLSRLLEEHREPLLTMIPAAMLQEVDLLFNFRGGASVRNELAHGKMGDGDFWSPDVVYATWLVLRMACAPAFRVWPDVAAAIARMGGLQSGPV